MKIIVCGGREYSNYDFLKEKLDALYQEYNFTTLVQGGARGADRLARRWAIENNIPYEQYDADWKRFNMAAGPIRNDEMLNESGATLVVAFPGNSGTWDMIKRARNKEGVKTIVYDDLERQSKTSDSEQQPRI